MSDAEPSNSRNTPPSSSPSSHGEPVSSERFAPKPDGPLAGLRVAALESRRADDMARLIARFGGTPHVSPSMREVPLAEPEGVIDFAHRLITGDIGVVILMTGVGLRHLIAAVEKRIDRQRFLDSLSDVTTIVRGPKPLAVMKDLGLTPTHRVPEPNTWRELLETIDRHVPIAGQAVAIQEYGKPNPSLVAGLEARGADVTTVTVYAWDFPEDRKPLEANIVAMLAGERDALLVTSAHQVTNLLRAAAEMGVEAELKEAMTRLAVCSIGPTTSEMLHERGLPVDLEPEHPKMGHLITEAAERLRPILDRKRRPGAAPSDGLPSSLSNAPMTISSRSDAASATPATSSSRPGTQGAVDPLDRLAPWWDSLFLRACRREPVERTPIWLMRQAGRYMAEYRGVRSSVPSVLELCKRPDLCSEVMCTAVEVLGVDAAIIFSDLLPILEPMGLNLEFLAGEGPRIDNPIRTASDVDRLMELHTMDELAFVPDTVRQTRADLPGEIPLIGFAGAPFTLASYAIEGGGSREYLHTKMLMNADDGAWRELMGRFSRTIVRYLQAQIDAGVQAVQIFDSWAGCLGPDDFVRFVQPYVREIIRALPHGVPVIYFATGNPALLPHLAATGASVVGIDWRIELDDAWRTVGHDRAVQGNLDPAALLAGPETIRRRVKEILAKAGNRPGHIFNLGHGVHKQTPVENAKYLVEIVRELSTR